MLLGVPIDMPPVAPKELLVFVGCDQPAEDKFTSLIVASPSLIVAIITVLIIDSTSLIVAF